MWLVDWRFRIPSGGQLNPHAVTVCESGPVGGGREINKPMTESDLSVEKDKHEVDE